MCSSDLLWGKKADEIYKHLRCCIFRPRPHYTVFKRKRNCFVPDRAIIPTTTPKTMTENGSIRKRSPEWNDLKTILFENDVFLVRTAKTMLSENDYVTTTTRPGPSLLNVIADRRFQVASFLLGMILVCYCK